MAVLDYLVRGERKAFQRLGAVLISLQNNLLSDPYFDQTGDSLEVADLSSLHFIDCSRSSLLSFSFLFTFSLIGVPLSFRHLKFVCLDTKNEKDKEINFLVTHLKCIFPSFPGSRQNCRRYRHAHTRKFLRGHHQSARQKSLDKVQSQIPYIGHIRYTTISLNSFSIFFFFILVIIFIFLILHFL